MGKPMGSTVPALGIISCLKPSGVSGWPLLVLVSAAMLLWPVTIQFDLAERRMHTRLFLIAGASTLGVFMVHSILWWKG